MNEKERILARFEKEKDRIFTPKWLAKSCRMEPGKVSYVLSRLMDEGKVKRVSRGMYKFAEKKKTAKKPKEKPSEKASKKPAKKDAKKSAKKARSLKLSKENLVRYLATLEKTCEIAIYELMLTEPFVGTDDKTEIEHQIAYFARHLVRSRWAIEQEAFESVEVTEETFRRARKIHQWSKFVFEGRRKK